ncbi:pseudouridine synthase [Synechococcus sp. M16CYN]|uniref:pseudouridine synthase n=1 Tax=Synechococcus sp. M16CYN TaxID=3103139 RepID=UPI003245B5F8
MAYQRLQKLIAAAGLCSRRHSERWLEAGRVTVDGRLAKLGDRADPECQTIKVDGYPLVARSGSRVLLLNKPAGVICSCHDPQGRRTVLDYLPCNERYGLHPVGRLDADSRGALLLTDRGDLTLRLTHPRYRHAKTYRVLVKGVPSHAALNHWRQGIELSEGLTQPALVRRIQVRHSCSLLEVELREGRNRQIRRIAGLLGHPVLDLQRTAINGLYLNDLTEGCWRQLSETEWMSILNNS